MKRLSIALVLLSALCPPALAASSLDATHVHGIAYDPADPERLLIATHHGLLALENGELAAVSERRDDFMGFSAHPEGGGVYLASGHPSGGGNLGVIISRDGGKSWEVLSPGADGPVDFHQMDISKADPDVMVGAFGTLQASRDGGRTWAVTGRPPAPLIGLALSATDAETVYAATQEGLFESPNLGANWQRVGDGSAPVTMVSATADGAVWAYDVARGLVRKAPGAEAFEVVGPTLGDDAILHFAVSGDEMAAATYKGALVGSVDGGATWEPLLD